MRIGLLVPILLTLAAAPACSQPLARDVYRNAQGNDPREVATAFVVLSHIELSPKFLERLEKDYRETEEDPAQFYYEFLLVKRTQNPDYARAFIESAMDNVPALLENQTDWVSIASPFYELLAMYGRTDDEALSVMVELMSSADGSVLSVVSEDLTQIYKRQPDRLENVMKSQNAPLDELRKLMED